MSVRPYKFRLKKTTRGEQRLIEAAYAYLPDTGMREGFMEGMRQALADEIGESISLKLETVEQGEFSEFMAKLPHHPIIAVIGLAPHTAKIVCEIDASLAALAVERMLGGQARNMPEPRQISETEQGVIQFLIARVLFEIHRRCKGDERVHFRFERFALSPDEASGVAREDAPCAMFAYRAGLGRHAGFVRLIVPNPFVTQAMLDVEAPDEVRVAERARFAEEMERYSEVRATIWAEAGRTTVTPADIRNLEEGDVILVEGGDLALSGGTAGRAVLKVGLGQGAGLDADVQLTGRRARACIRGVHRGD